MRSRGSRLSPSLGDRTHFETHPQSCQTRLSPLPNGDPNHQIWQRFLPTIWAQLRCMWGVNIVSLFLGACVLAIAISVIAVQGMEQRLTWFLGVVFAVFALLPDRPHSV